MASTTSVGEAIYAFGNDIATNYIGKYTANKVYLCNDDGDCHRYMIIGASGKYSIVYDRLLSITIPVDMSVGSPIINKISCMMVTGMIDNNSTFVSLIGVDSGSGITLYQSNNIKHVNSCVSQSAHGLYEFVTEIKPSVLKKALKILNGGKQ